MSNQLAKVSDATKALGVTSPLPANKAITVSELESIIFQLPSENFFQGGVEQFSTFVKEYPLGSLDSMLIVLVNSASVEVPIMLLSNTNQVLFNGVVNSVGGVVITTTANNKVKFMGGYPRKVDFKALSSTGHNDVSNWNSWVKRGTISLSNSSSGVDLELNYQGQNVNTCVLVAVIKD